MNKRDALDYYQNALAQTRQQVNYFAKQYPQAASHLQLGPSVMEDPHISRLIESFSLMSARIDALIDDCYPKITQAMINNIYPSYLCHIPSMSIVQLSPYKTLQKKLAIPKGTLLESALVNNKPCNFQTGFDCTIIPAKLSTISTSNNKISFELLCLDKDVHFSNLDINTLRIYINSDEKFSINLLGFLYKYLSCISLNNKTSKANIRKVGFDNEQAILPRQSHDLDAYRLLTEFMYFKQKFFFFDIEGLELTHAKDRLTIDLHFDEILPDSILNIGYDQLRINCIPIINCFEKNLEPIQVSHFKSDYSINTDKRYSEHYMIHHISKVCDASTGNPIKRQYSDNNNELQYNVHYHHSALNSYDNSAVTLSLTENDELLTLNEISLEITGICSNGDIPSTIIWPHEQNHFQFANQNYPIGKIQCLVQPTPIYNSHVNSKHLQQALTLFNQGQLGLYQEATAKDSLIKLLNLYNFSRSPTNRAFINSIKQVTLNETYRHINEDLLNPLQYGVNIEIMVDNRHYFENGLFLFKELLTNIYKQHLAINSFVNLKIAQLEDSLTYE